MKNSKKDYLIAAIVGFYTALLLLPTFKNISVSFGSLYIILLFVIPALWMIGLALARFLGRFLAVFNQLGKFVVVGFANTAIDFGVLNFLSIVTAQTSGFLIGGVNLPGFTLAALHSYFWNKFWVFKKSGEPKQKPDYSDFWTFIAVVVVGVFINGGIIILLTTYVNPLFGLSAGRWLNVSKVVATAVSLIWNFVGFKFLVFKPKAKKAEVEMQTKTA